MLWRGDMRRSGMMAFSLVEVLIVVTIIAILAGIVFPHYVNVSESARASSMLTDIQEIRSQLQVYQAEHNGQYPTLAQMWGNITNATDANGNLGGNFGPYLRQAPTNPFTNGSVCAADNSADWQYDETLGSIWGVVSAAQIVDLELLPNDVVAAP